MTLEEMKEYILNDKKHEQFMIDTFGEKHYKDYIKQLGKSEKFLREEYWLLTTPEKELERQMDISSKAADEMEEQVEALHRLSYSRKNKPPIY